MKARVGDFVIVCSLLAACEQKPPEPKSAAVARPEVVAAAGKPSRTTPYSETPILGKAGDDLCVQPPGELMLGGDKLSCLTLLFTSIKPEDPAKPDVKAAKMRAAFYQPGPSQKDKTIGWITYDVRVDCASKQGWMLGDVQYDPNGAEIMKETAPGGAAPFPPGEIGKQLIEGVCG